MSQRNKLAKKAKPTEIISHWPQLIENFQFSPQEFYAKVQEALMERQVPDLKVCRVDWKEGGVLSPRREYLRLTRERLIFDICAAPFGTGFFVSLWFGERPLRLGYLTWLLIVAGFMAFLNLLPFGTDRLYWGLRQAFFLSHGQTLLILWTFVVLPPLLVVVQIGPNLDNFLIGSPILGYFYERYFRRITYYRIDRQCMYQQAVHNAVVQVIDQITQPKGVRPLSELDRRPVMGALLERQGSNGRH